MECMAHAAELCLVNFFNCSNADTSYNQLVKTQSLQTVWFVCLVTVCVHKFIKLCVYFFKESTTFCVPMSLTN